MSPKPDLLSDGDSEEIQEAVNLLNRGSVNRIDGDGWKVYKVGSDTIRVDIKANKEE